MWISSFNPRPFAHVRCRCFWVSGVNRELNQTTGSFFLRSGAMEGMIQSANGLGPGGLGFESKPPGPKPLVDTVDLPTFHRLFSPPQNALSSNMRPFSFFKVVLFGLNKKNQKEVLFVFLFGCPFIHIYKYIHIYTKCRTSQHQKTPVGQPMK